MALNTCCRSSTRKSDPLKALSKQILHGQSLLPMPSAKAAFSTRSGLHVQQGVVTKPNVRKYLQSDNKGQEQKSKGLYLGKKKRPTESKGRPPAPGERKAIRKRIVLSNTNALEVPGLEEFTVDAMIDMRLRGQVLAIPGPVVDQLRGVEAFKVGQSWRLFRKPSMLIRKETVEYGQLIASMSEEGRSARTIRRVLVGERGSGKSTLLLQAMAMAFMKNWVVINLPNAQDLVIGNIEYGPIPSTSPPLYNQKTYTASLLSAISQANSTVLSTLTLSKTHSQSPIPLQANISLDRLAKLGASDPGIAFPIFTILWSELTQPSTEAHPRPPIFLGIDSLAHAMKPKTAYYSSDFKPIHALDLALLKFYTDHLSGACTLPNGGMILAATSESNNPAVDSLRLALAQLEGQQAVSAQEQRQRHQSDAHPRKIKLPPLHSSINTRVPTNADLISPFLLATTGSPTTSPVPTRDAFKEYDERVLAAFADPGIRIQRLQGLNKDEARGLMEYWARSGVFRSSITENLIGERWTVAGGGVIGELERSCVGVSI